MIGSRAWLALMRRNWIYRRRHFLSSVLELLLPVAFVGVLVAIKNASKDASRDTVYRPEKLPDSASSLIPLSFIDYTIALQAKRQCVTIADSDFEISGILDNGRSWPIPFIKCDSRKCKFLGQDASEFCEYPILAVAPANRESVASKDRAEDFLKWLYGTYPILKETRNRYIGASTPNDAFATDPNMTKTALPMDYDFAQLFRDSADIDRYVRLPEYGLGDNPKIALAIVWDATDDDINDHQYVYSIRQNSTNYNAPEGEPDSRLTVLTTPDTARLFHHYAKSDNEVCALPDIDSPKLGSLENSCTAQYAYNGVIAIQRLVNDYILERSGAADAGFYVSTNGVAITQLPTKPFYMTGFFESVEDTAPILLILGLLYPFATMISYVTQEKELHQKELMKIMSVNESDIGQSWFATFFVFHIVSATLCAIVSGILYTNSSMMLIFVLWQLMLLASIVFSMMCAALSSKANRAVLIGILVYFAGVFFSLAVDHTDSALWLLKLLSLHPATAFSFALKEIGKYEDQRIGLDSNNARYSTDSISGYSFSTALQFLAIDVVLYGFLTFYFNRVIPPGDNYGQALKPWFLFLKSYWMPNTVNGGGNNRTILQQDALEQIQNVQTTNDDDDPDGTERSEIAPGVFGRTKEVTKDGIPMEPVPTSLLKQASEGKSIEIRKLRKIFGKEKIAVDNLSLSMYSGQITALLGHNGAGKTTTINMLTGLVSPTSGIATITGLNVATDMDKIRQDIGICFQHDCLFPNLTVKEHLQFFARLKGLYEKQKNINNNNSHNNSTTTSAKDSVNLEIIQALRDVGLYEKRHTRSKNLSGGMKRKLSVAIAFCGGSKIVLLDEPTSGMDPFSRRFTWNVIRQYRKNRCIILTTHFMDEADVLGDRIAIMAEGKLKCCGSSLFLKRYYGVGYQLTIATNPSYLEEDSEEVILRSSTNGEETSLLQPDKVSINSLKRIVEDSVPEAVPLSDVGTELSYQLPVAASSKFVGMFENLDEMINTGFVCSYGVSVTTMEEVFLLVTRGYTGIDKPLQEVGSLNGAVPTGLSEETESVDESDLKKNRLEFVLEERSSVLFVRHVFALLKKRGTYFKRDKTAWICTTLVPSIFVFIGFAVFTFLGGQRDLQPLTLDLSDYNIGVTESPKNPVYFNSPNNPYHCSPGSCAYKPNIMEEITGEQYLFCGYVSKLLMTTNSTYDHNNVTCTVPFTEDIMNTIMENVADPIMTDATNVYESSRSLLDTSDAFAATQYGAIWFTHLPNSTMPGIGNANYKATVVKQCVEYSTQLNYLPTDYCETFGGVGYVVGYNFTALHATPMFISMADEALARFATKNDNLRIQFTIAPLPITAEEAKVGASEDALTTWFLVVLSFPFIAGAYASFVVSEKSSKAKHLQTVAGVKPSAYWISTFVWDTLNYQIPLWITVGLMFAFQINILTTSDRDVFSGILSLLILFGPASAGFTYCITFAFTSASLCNVSVVISGFLIGLGGPITCFILQILAADPIFPKPNLAKTADILAAVLRLVPAFCLGKGLFNAINIETFVYLEDNVDMTVWDPAILKSEVYALAIECIAYPLLAIVIDIGYTNPAAMMYMRWLSPVTYIDLIKNSLSKIESSNDTLAAPPDDDDVLQEQMRVVSGGADSELIVINNITKTYPNGKKAINNLSLAIPSGQCFGLLGINGAGKTTTMGILTAEFPPSSGDARLAGHSVTMKPQKIRRRIGYCPQFDAHFPNLTGREHVELYASIKGVPLDLVKELSARKLEEVGLSAYDSNRLSSTYSGGMKRRLSLACATVGSPQIIMLDEPCTGVDPVSRREIWHLINKIVNGVGLAHKDKPSVILTTHSMEECEALCPRIGIMANGKLSCLGSAQHLKDKFGKGFQIELKIKIVTRKDLDYEQIYELLQVYPTTDKSHLALAENIKDDNDSRDDEDENDERVSFFNLEECRAALQTLSTDGFISDTIQPDDTIGHAMWAAASSPYGVSLWELSVFATTVFRMKNVQQFMNQKFPKHVLRERQDTKSRYEVERDGIRISDIFANVEQHKDELLIADYSVSQTSLEQVFNMHAASAERYKQDARID